MTTEQLLKKIKSDLAWKRLCQPVAVFEYKEHYKMEDVCQQH